MNKILKIFFFLFCLIFLFYLLLPNPNFPKALPDAIQSSEPADIETPLRRGYFTDMTREEVLAFYQSQLVRSSFLKIPLPTYRLNYPPEEAQTLIRDQARSTFLEEIVHPFRESIFVNGFEPKLAKDVIFTSNKYWRQKIIVRYVPSSPGMRLAVAVPTLFLMIILAKDIKHLKKGKNA